MKSLGLSVSFAGLMLCGLLLSPANAGQQLLIEADQSQVIAVPGVPGAVIVGNPAIADVTTHGDKIFVHARAFGQTNLLILDEQGNQITAFDVVVTHGTSSNLALFKGTKRMSYSCAPNCEPEMQIGDDANYFEATTGMADTKMKLASKGLGDKGSGGESQTAPPQ